MSRTFWIAEIRIDPAVEQKIRTRRGVTGPQVREACVPDAYEEARWATHPVHGERLLVRARTADGTLVRVILQPVDVAEGVCRLRTVLRE